LSKSAVVLAIVVAFVIFSDVAVTLAFPALICYGIYYLIWATLIRPNVAKQMQGPGPSARTVQLHAASAESSTDRQTAIWQPGGANTAAAATPTARRRKMRPNWRERANQELAARPLRDKCSELLGSMILSAMFAAIAACVAPVLLGDQGPSDRLAVHLWLALVGTLGSWAILVPAKFAEGKLEDQVPMRMTLLALGAAVGLVAWWLGNLLLIHVPSWGEPVDVRHGLVSQEMLRWSRPENGANPSAAVYMTYFAFLFLVPRWWRQGESTRNGRLSVWWVLVCVFWAWLLHFFWWFPQPAGMMVAAVIAVSTQLASPWMPPSRRRALSEMMEQTA
jgi:hypothetical protein